MPEDLDCMLCQAEHLTEWHYEDNDCWVADDINPRAYERRILGVYKPHGETPSIPVLAKILNQMLAAVYKPTDLEDIAGFDPYVTIGGHWHIQLNIEDT